MSIILEKKPAGTIAASLKISLAENPNKSRKGFMKEYPMMGHRGVRLGVTYP
jgi:hypothetical protein